MNSKGKHPDNKKPKGKKEDPMAKKKFVAEGVAAVTEYIKYKPSLIRALFSDQKNKPTLEAIMKKFDFEMEIQLRSEDASRTAPIEAQISLAPIDESQMLEDIRSRNKDLIVAVDHITDPRNLGAILRTAAFFGVKHVIAPSRRQVLLTQASVATAQGAFAVTDLVCVTNLVRTLRELKNHGYWLLGAAMDGEHFTNVIGEYEKQILILGNEESGISRLVSEACDRMISIESGPNNLESLNVSVAGGILINSLSPKGLTVS
jgi:predicted rRNA methylase